MIIKRKSRKSERNGSGKHLSSAVGVPEGLLKDMTAVFKLLADKSRLTMVMALAKRGPMHVTDLCKLLGQSQPAVSHHLTLMRMVGLVGYDREGKHNFYYLASDHLRDLLEQFFSDTGNSGQSLEFDDFALTFSRREDS
jgi:ArsR family transcriptional regulator, arsenate/arsenite/antimonite-responsive transcriptional repressor